MSQAYIKGNGAWLPQGAVERSMFTEIVSLIKQVWGPICDLPQHYRPYIIGIIIWLWRWWAGWWGHEDCTFIVTVTVVISGNFHNIKNSPTPHPLLLSKGASLNDWADHYQWWKELAFLMVNLEPLANQDPDMLWYLWSVGIVWFRTSLCVKARWTSTWKWQDWRRNTICSQTCRSHPRWYYSPLGGSKDNWEPVLKIEVVVFRPLCVK